MDNNIDFKHADKQVYCNGAPSTREGMIQNKSYLAVILFNKFLKIWVFKLDVFADTFRVFGFGINKLQVVL